MDHPTNESANPLQDASTAPEDDGIAQRVIDCVEDMAGRKVELTDRFRELQMDSLDIAEMAISIEDEFDLELTTDQFEAMQSPLTVEALITHVRGVIAAKEANEANQAKDGKEGKE